MSQSWDNVVSTHDHLLTVHAHKPYIDHNNILIYMFSLLHLPVQECPLVQCACVDGRLHHSSSHCKILYSKIMPRPNWEPGFCEYTCSVALPGDVCGFICSQSMYLCTHPMCVPANNFFPLLKLVVINYSRAATKTFIVVELHTRIMKRLVLSSIPSFFSASAFVRSFTSLLMAFSIAYSSTARKHVDTI